MEKNALGPSVCMPANYIALKNQYVNIVILYPYDIYLYLHLPTGDLAVDWISDKLYWAVRKEGKIEELDLETEQRRVVVQSAPKTAVFSGLAIYPYPNNG